MDREYVGVCFTCSVGSGQEVLRLTGGSRVEIRGWVLWFYVSCDISGIAATSVRGVSETCVVCHCSRRGKFN